jgi:hypothetical protein
VSWLDRWLDRRLHTRVVGQSRTKGPAIGPPPFADLWCVDCANMAIVNAQLRQERDALRWLADPVYMAAYLLAREAVEEG